MSPPATTRILGIDPGSRITGYGLIDSSPSGSHEVACGCIETGAADMPGRLERIFLGLREVIERYAPEEAAIEQVFMHRNPDSALKLGQARGAAVVACVACGLKPAEYSPASIKQAVVGRGRADKGQVQHMVAVLLNHRGELQADAADALAVALCHAHTRAGLGRIAGAGGLTVRGGRLR